MKIQSRKALLTTANTEVEQDTWIPLSTRIQTDFHIAFPQRPAAIPFFGHLALLHQHDAITAIQLSLTREDISKNADEQEQIDLNYLAFEGRFADDDLHFQHQLGIRSAFGRYDGWTFEFASAPSILFSGRPELNASAVSCVKITADIVCCDEFTVSTGNKTVAGGQGIEVQLVTFPLGEIGRLREVICDAIGTSYLEMLLRVNGYEPQQ